MQLWEKSPGREKLRKQRLAEMFSGGDREEEGMGGERIHSVTNFTSVSFFHLKERYLCVCVCAGVLPPDEHLGS